MTKLGFLANDWANAPIATNDFITPKDGQYKVIIEKVDYAERDNDGNECDPTFIFTFTIEEGENKGQKFRRFTTIRSPKAMSYFKRDLQIIGIPIPKDPEELINIVIEAVGVILIVTVKSRTYNEKRYIDVYFDKRIGKQNMQQQMPEDYNPFVDESRAQRPQANREPQTNQQTARQPQTYQQTARQPQSWEQQPAGYQEAPFNPDAYERIPF
ncbi:MAG: hypothetical protein MJZ10_11975 [Fibrobacter sp.]|nr:hypothetical protein [Fibrobacter sp.]